MIFFIEASEVCEEDSMERLRWIASLCSGVTRGGEEGKLKACNDEGGERAKIIF